MTNEFNVARVAKASFTIPNLSAATTVSSGVFIPAGAIITGLRMVAPAAVTLTGASATVAARVGSVAIMATSRVSALPAVSTPSIVALATTTGIYSPGGELTLIAQASSNSAATATYDVYVDYLYA
jgi:hypothetical protein